MRIQLDHQLAAGIGILTIGAVVCLLVVQVAAGGKPGSPSAALPSRSGSGAVQAAPGTATATSNPKPGGTPGNMRTGDTPVTSQQDASGRPSLPAPTPTHSMAGQPAPGASTPTPFPWPGGNPGITQQPGFATLPSAPSSALVSPPALGKSDVADLLRKPLVPGKSLQLDAYAVTLLGPPSMPAPVPGLPCPLAFLATLVDRPFQPTLAFLNIGESTLLPDGEPWLIAASLEQAKAGYSLFVPPLPYHASLQGHLGDAAYAKCPHAHRIFDVERVLQIYEQAAPVSSTIGASVPAGYGAWPSYADAAGGYTVRYPPGWKVQRLDAITVALFGQQAPGSPVLIRVHGIETLGTSGPGVIYSPMPRGRFLGVLSPGPGALRRNQHPGVERLSRRVSK